MAEQTGISWADGTHNWWVGCQETGSPACVPCYAREWNARYAPTPPDGGPKVAPNWGPHAPRRLTAKSNRGKIRLWNREPHRLNPPPGTKPFVFGGSLMDFADNMVDPAWRADQFAAYRAAQNLVFLMLTKRIGNVAKMAAAAGGWGSNMALGITVVNQEEADRDIPKLLECARLLRLAGQAPLFLFLSVEPICGYIEIRNAWLAEIAWVIVGGPTDQGPHKSWPIATAWVNELRIATEDTGGVFHFKQWGEWIPKTPKKFTQMQGHPRWKMADGEWCARVGKNKAGRTLGGKEHNGRPRIAA